MPCFVLSTMFPQVHMFRYTCLGFYAMFFYVLFLFLLYVNVRVTCSHAWYHVYGYVLLRSMCLYAHSMLLCLYPSLHMLVCLDSCSTMSMCYISTCLHVCSYAYILISMFPHACVFGSMLSTCFMLFSMCLCALCHVRVPRPSLCLSCHVLM